MKGERSLFKMLRGTTKNETIETGAERLREGRSDLVGRRSRSGQAAGRKSFSPSWASERIQGQRGAPRRPGRVAGGTPVEPFAIVVAYSRPRMRIRSAVIEVV